MADTPGEGEAAQALFCAIADYLGVAKVKKVLNLEKYPTYASFKRSNKKLIEDSFSKRVNTPTVSLQRIETFLSEDAKNGSPPNGWYISSVNIAIKLITDIHKISRKFSKIQAPNWQDIFYFRGGPIEKAGPSNPMETISKLFDAANATNKQFGDINKWSPADIYFSSKKASDKLVEQLNIANKSEAKYTFDDLNNCISDLLNSGDLLGVSLKKSITDVEIVEMNFEEEETQKKIKNIVYDSITEKPKPGEKGSERDIKIYFSKDKRSYIKIRHDPHSDSLTANKAIKTEIEVKGAGGRGGSLVSFGTGNPNGSGLSDLVASVDEKFGKELAKAFDTGFSNYKKSIENLNKTFEKKLGLKSSEKLNKKLLEEEYAPKQAITSLNLKGDKGKPPTYYDWYKAERILLSIKYVVGSYESLLRKYFTKNPAAKGVIEHQKNSIVRAFYRYAASLSPKSGKFIIAK